MAATTVTVPNKDNIANYPPAAGEAIVTLATQTKADLTSLFAGGASTNNKCRAVATSLAAYAGSGTGTLTGSVNGAIGAQDGLTLVAGDLLFVPGALTNVTAKDSGPWVVSVVGTAGTKYVLTRPAWFTTGAAIVQGAVISVSGEGTVWAGSEWKAFAAKAKVVDTDDAVWYPKSILGSQALSSASPSVATVSNLYVSPVAQASVVDATAANAIKAVLTAGYGTGSLALTGPNTVTDVIKYTITGW